MSSLLRSRDIKDYFEGDFAKIRAGEPVPFSMHLYFSGTNHVMLWRPAGEVIGEEFLGKYRDRGVTKFWILRSEKKAWDKYVAEKIEAPQPAAKTETVVAAPEPKAPPPPPRTIEAQKILVSLKAPDKPVEKKSEEVAQVAQQVLKQMTQPTTAASQKPAQDHARKVVQEVLSGALDQVSSVAEEIWRLSDVEPTFEHAVNVSTYSVLFALSFGRIELALLADVALAGLLHDIGLSQIPAEDAPKIWKQQSQADRDRYQKHVEAGIDLIDAYAPQTSARVRTILVQSHEKFDGTGYPKRLQGFQLDDVAQLVCMADLFDSIGSGRWDGEVRPLGVTLETLEKLEKARTFPENFNPEVFSTVLKWTKSDKSREQMSVAVDVVKEQTRKLMDKDKDKAKAS
ncbi:MAG TPA: HD domain-containing phosphohydrolase [Bdellovibrionota bacterium]|nr:HD domain-containing phosphohydrolase [Bdellovibrionota bacterium]